MTEGVWSNLVVVESLPGLERDLESSLTEMALRSRKEEGCLQYDCFQSYENPRRFLLQIRWRDAVCLERHLVSERLSAFFDAVAGKGLRGDFEADYRAFSREESSR